MSLWSLIARERLQTRFGRCRTESRPITALAARGRAGSPAPERPPCARSAAAPASAKPGLQTFPSLRARSGLLRLVLLLVAAPALGAPVEPARIGIENGQFVAGGERIWINGANTPWNHWNDFGGNFDQAWWEDQFRQLQDNGINAARVWLTCNGEVGLLISPSGEVSGATAEHWRDLDQLFAIAARHRIRVMATVMSFDHFKAGHPKSQRWRNWLASDRNIDSFADHYLVPLVERYGSSPWLWSIDLMNEPDWVHENAEDGRFAWERLQRYFARGACAVHEHSRVLVTVGLAMLKYNSGTGPVCRGNQVSDRALQALVPRPGARLDFYTTHYYDWNGRIWGNALHLSPAAYRMPPDKPALIGEMPAKGTAGHTITDDYEIAFEEGWLGVMAWTSNGVDENGSLADLGPATRAFRTRHPEVLDGGGGEPGGLLAPSFSGVEALVARRVPWLQGHVRFERLRDASGDAFELSTEGGGLVIRGSTANAAAAGLGWYLKYFCHRSISHVGDNLSAVAVLPRIDRPLRIDARVRYRYALNYCTYNYTMSFYSWKDWEHELDWMALNGVNLMLVANGEEAVWSATLRRLGYSDAEIANFIPGPGYTAWWLMGNLEGFGGPMAPAMVARRSAVQRRIIARLRSLGIEPVLPGFYGMVPAILREKLSAHIVDQGRWADFQRPGILDPTDPAFARVAGIYYDEIGKLYGRDLRFFSGDPFHEGGVIAGIDLGRAGGSIQAAMQSHFPGAVWVLQGWLDNPRKELIAACDRSHLLIEELFGESTHNWEIRRGYEGTPFLWCCIDDFGERPGLFGKLQRYADETYRARTGEFGGYLQGVGIMPEGIDNNPVAYDIVLETAWHREHLDASKWLEGYVEYRYGRADPDLAAAWALLLQTAYGNVNGGIPENVLLARPAIPACPVTTWGKLDLGYDPAVFAHAVDVFSRAAGRFEASETYRLDRIALRTQVLSNEALAVSAEVAAALGAKNRPAFERAVERFLGLGRATDELLGAEASCRLSTYENRALAYGNTPAEKANCLRNALMLVTYWGGNDRKTDEDHDYAFKAWSGMMTSYYLKRWEMYFDYCRRRWDGLDAAAPDFFAWERQWVDDQVAAARPETPANPVGASSQSR